MTRFLTGQTPPAREAEIAEHLRQCPDCQNRAETVSDGTDRRALLAGLPVRALASAASGSLVELQGRLQALPLYDQTDDDECDVTSSTVTSGITVGDRGHESQAALPQRLGKFEIIRQLGAGGFGIVYLATDTALDRLVALKLPRASMLADPDSRRRFFREAKALARLDHPNIVGVFEAGECDGTCYLAVEYCDGPTLDEWRREQPGPVAPKTAARLLLALANAVEDAHQHGIYHRDIKPANVLLSDPHDETQIPFQPRLADFGLARIADHEPNQATMSGVVLGTPQYLAPEQAAGLTDRVGPQTDVYALGAVLYELITGRPPIVGATSIDTLRRVLVDEPVAARQIVGTVPEALEKIAAKCLEKSTEFRYATARDLADDLGRFLEGKPIQAGSRGRTTRRRNSGRPLATMASVVIGLMACLAIWITIVSRSSQTGDAKALTDALQMSGASSAASHIQQAPSVAMARTVESHRVVPARLANSEGEAANGTPFPFNLPAQSYSSIRYQQIYSRTEFDSPGKITGIRFRRDEAEPPFATAGIDIRIHLSYANTTLADLSPIFAQNIGAERTTVLDTSSLVLSSQGMGVPRPFDIFIPFTNQFSYDPARGDLLLEIFVRNSIGTAQFDFSGGGEQGTTRRVFAPSANATTGSIDSTNSKPVGLVTRFDMLIDAKFSNQQAGEDSGLFAADPSFAVRRQMNIAHENMVLCKFAEAEAQLRKLLGQASTSCEQGAVALDAEGCLGECLARQGKFAEAERLLMASHDCLARQDGAVLSQIRTCHERLVQLYEAWGQQESASQWRSQWANIRRKEIAASPFDAAERAVALQRLAFLSMKYRDFAASEPPLRDCLALRVQALGPEHRSTIDTENRLGECLAGLNRFDEAEQYLLESYSGLSQLSNIPASWYPNYCQRLINLYNDWGKPDEAKKWHDEWQIAIRREIASLPSERAERVTALYRLGRTLLQHGQYADAEPLMRECLLLRERLNAQHWTTHNARSYLGASLAGQQKYEEAEPLLLTGYQGLVAQRDQIDSASLRAPEIALQRLIKLYEDWGKPDVAQNWKSQLDLTTSSQK